jgi:hypothetical protein
LIGGFHEVGIDVQDYGGVGMHNETLFYGDQHGEAQKKVQISRSEQLFYWID